MPGMRNTTEQMLPRRSNPQSCGQLEHSTAPSQHSVVMALPQRGDPSWELLTVRAAQHFPAPQQGCEDKDLTLTPGEGRLCHAGLSRLGGSTPGLAIMTDCLNDSCSFLSLPIPRNDGAVCYSLSPVGLRSAAGS